MHILASRKPHLELSSVHGINVSARFFWCRIIRHRSPLSTGSSMRCEMSRSDYRNGMWHRYVSPLLFERIPNTIQVCKSESGNLSGLGDAHPNNDLNIHQDEANGNMCSNLPFTNLNTSNKCFSQHRERRLRPKCSGGLELFAASEGHRGMYLGVPRSQDFLRSKGPSPVQDHLRPNG